MERNYAGDKSIGTMFGFLGYSSGLLPLRLSVGLGCIPSALMEVVVEESAVVSQSRWGGMPACQPASQFMLRRNSLSYYLAAMN